jgi:hypothetical protein
MTEKSDLPARLQLTSALLLRRAFLCLRPGSRAEWSVLRRARVSAKREPPSGDGGYSGGSAGKGLIHVPENCAPGYTEFSMTLRPCQDPRR